MDLQLNDRAYLITGGTDGLGLALAQRLTSEGARVAVCGRDTERLETAQQTLGPEALCFEADVTDANQLDEFIDNALARFSRLDGAINNAGRSAGFPVATSSDEQWREDLELKVLSAVHVSRRVLDALELTQGAIGGRDGVREHHVLRAITYGLVSVISRQEADFDRILRAVSGVREGRLEMPEVALGWLVNQIRAIQQDVLEPKGLTTAGLETREVDVLRLLADGLGTPEIATKLNYSERTVKNIIHGVLTRLKLRNRAHAVAFALRNGAL